jgi:hypothetical protein
LPEQTLVRNLDGGIASIIARDQREQCRRVRRMQPDTTMRSGTPGYECRWCRESQSLMEIARGIGALSPHDELVNPQ